MKNYLILLMLVLATAGCSPAALASAAGSEKATNTTAAQASPAGSETATNTTAAQASATGSETATNTTAASRGNNIDTIATGEITILLSTPIPGNLDNPAQKYVNLARQDLATRLNIDINQVTVNNVTALTGVDLSTGCVLKSGQLTMPDQSVDGFEISLSAQGQDYLYHAGLDSQLILCQKMNTAPGKPLQTPTP